jgi:hypothetical protein
VLVLDLAQEIVDAEIALQIAGSFDDPVCKFKSIGAADEFAADAFEVSVGNLDVRRPGVMQEIERYLWAAVNVFCAKLSRRCETG